MSPLVKLTISCLFAILIMTPDSANSHPWGGLVIDAEGNIYFTFICPMVDNDHHACVWKIDPNQELSEVLQSRRSPSDIVLARTQNRIIYGAERTGQNPNQSYSLWRINESGGTPFIKPTTNQELFFIQSYAVSDDGDIYFARDSKIFVRSSDQSISEFKLDQEIGRIGLLSFSPSGKLFIVAEDGLYKKNKNGLELIAKQLKEENPENIPFRGANILFDMTIDKDENIYLAYYGNRQVIRISADREKKVILEAKAPWSPHGIDIHNGEVYVLESTLGDGKWWEFWNRNDDRIIPRIRRINADGTVSVIYDYLEANPD